MKKNHPKFVDVKFGNRWDHQPDHRYHLTRHPWCFQRLWGFTQDGSACPGRTSRGTADNAGLPDAMAPFGCGAQDPATHLRNLRWDPRKNPVVSWKILIYGQMMLKRIFDDLG